MERGTDGTDKGGGTTRVNSYEVLSGAEDDVRRAAQVVRWHGLHDLAHRLDALGDVLGAATITRA